MVLPRSDPVASTTRRLSRLLQQAGIPHAMMGGCAVEAHGGRRFRDTVLVLLTSEGLDQFRQKHVTRFYDQVPNRSRRFVERQSGLQIEAMLTGHHPGRRGPGPFAYPDPIEVREKVDQMWVVSLPHLIQLRLASGSFYEMAEVVSLIEANNLDESCMERLHPSVRGGYLTCLDEIRREEQFWKNQDAMYSNLV
jgi:hypothetical protein